MYTCVTFYIVERVLDIPFYFPRTIRNGWFQFCDRSRNSASCKKWIDQVYSVAMFGRRRQEVLVICPLLFLSLAGYMWRNRPKFDATVDQMPLSHTYSGTKTHLLYCAHQYHKRGALFRDEWWDLFKTSCLTICASRGPRPRKFTLYSTLPLWWQCRTVTNATQPKDPDRDVCGKPYEIWPLYRGLSARSKCEKRYSQCMLTTILLDTAALMLLLTAVQVSLAR